MQAEQGYEKLGLFYLGRQLDLHNRELSPTPFLYKSKHLTTHAAIIGMTGSGKTGLGIGLIEEAIMDDIPAIVIDPKGDMGNLLLTFPQLLPQDFLPWIDPAEAARKEMTTEELAAKTAGDWQAGLADWGQSTARVQAMTEKANRTIYTPGSNSGMPVSVLSSFSAPDPDTVADLDTLNSLVNSTVTSILALIDISGDTLQSREHILLSSILLHYWRKGEDLTMEKLIGNIVQPPFDKIGVFPLDTYYGQSDRMQLAMSLNNILASPSFAAWTKGEPLDIQQLLYTADGKPRTAIFSIAHLSESERMFFVTMLLNRFISWMRRQQGSSSLKALLYMDEIFGYFPPTANPPSKKPMLLLLKQARAYGVGVVLATQNPVDLDYKGLSNIGTWCVGRLQTSQDQERVAEGISGASEGKMSKAEVKELLAGMKGRQFLLNSAHLDAPLLFATRWVLSFLKGPISASDIKTLMAGRKKEAAKQVAAAGMDKQATRTTPAGTSQAPLLSPQIKQLYYLHNIIEEHVVFQPWLAAEGSVRFYNSTRNIDEVKQIHYRLYLDEHCSGSDWQQAEQTHYPLSDCQRNPPADAVYGELPAAISDLKNLTALEKEFANYLYQNQRLELFRVKPLKLESRPGETEGEFQIRLTDLLREKKDEAVEKMRKKYQLKQQRLEKRLATALARHDKEQIDVKAKTTDTVISFGVAVVGALFGRKTLSTGNVSRAATGMRNVGRVAKEKGDVRRAREKVAQLEQELADLTWEIEQQVVEMADSFSVDNFTVETFAIKPRRSDIFNLELCLLWEHQPAMVKPQLTQ